MTLSREYASFADAQTDASNHWRERTNRARAKIEEQKDPALFWKRIVRAKDQNLAAAEEQARDAYHAMHATVPSGIPAQVHPEVQEKLAAFLAEQGLEGRDLTRPMVDDGAILSEMVANARAVAQADHDKAMAALAAMERGAAVKDLEEAQARLARVEADYADVPVIDAIEQAVAELPKRGPGRPAKRLPVGQDLSQVLTADD